jgi:hypothetical protein
MEIKTEMTRVLSPTQLEKSAILNSFVKEVKKNSSQITGISIRAEKSQQSG